jgi:hypothetical protein
MADDFLDVVRNIVDFDAIDDTDFEGIADTPALPSPPSPEIAQKTWDVVPTDVTIMSDQYSYEEQSADNLASADALIVTPGSVALNAAEEERPRKYFRCCIMC